MAEGTACADEQLAESVRSHQILHTASRSLKSFGEFDGYAQILALESTLRRGMLQNPLDLIQASY